jgi:putative intracellular protease/amidase
MGAQKVLFITTSHDALGNTGEKTGVWLEELAAPYYVFDDADVTITIASPKGGEVPIDPKSLDVEALTTTSLRFHQDHWASNSIQQAIALKEINEAEYDAVFLPGGHGPMWDLADNKVLKKILEAFYNNHKPMGFVCHGVAGLVSLQNKEGDPMVKGLKMTSFSDSEEEATGLTRVVPFLLETKLRSLGANYHKGADFSNYVIADDNIITGQNPASSEDVAIEILSMITPQKTLVEYDETF